MFEMHFVFYIKGILQTDLEILEYFPKTSFNQNELKTMYMFTLQN